MSSPIATTSTPSANRNPWLWIPSLYFAEGIPYVMVMIVSVIMYKRLGISNTDIALYTSWLYLPWVIKPLWSPIVDLLGTKRRWIVVMQALIAITLAMVAFSIPSSRFFQYTIAFFWLMAFFSATHDIAADGFYMLGMKQHQQAAYVGIRSTFYRFATIAAQGLLVILAGSIESSSGLPPITIEVAYQPEATSSTVAFPESQTGTAQAAGSSPLWADPTTVQIGANHDESQLKAILSKAKESNVRNGFSPDVSETDSSEETQQSWWTRHVSEKLGNYLRTNFGDSRQALTSSAGSIGVTSVRLAAKPDPGQTIVVAMSRQAGDERIEIVEGGRLTFTEQNWDKTALVVFKVNPKLKTSAEAVFTGTSGNIPFAWTTVVLIMAVVFVAFAIYHKFALPYPAIDGPSRTSESHGMAMEFFRTFVSFFKKERMGAIIAFLLFFRFAEAQLVKLVTPFLLDPRDVGGLGLTTGQVGLAYGTIGVSALMIGGLLGGFLISRQGLRFWLWPMVIIMHSPDLAFVYLAYVQPESLALISVAVAVEQFGYGFGFTAYMMFMIMIAEGKQKTAHYAICTGFMALGMMIPGMFSGWLQEHIGYQHFFIWVVLSTIPGFIVAGLVKIDPEFGRKRTEPRGLPVAPTETVSQKK